MTRVWVYSLGPDLGLSFPDISFPQHVIDDITSELGRRSGLPECSVRLWSPFRSEREHRGERQFIVLLVCDWRKFTKRDYFVAANALALHKSGTVGLFPAMIGPVEAGASNDVWLERNRLLWERLAKIAVMGPYPEAVGEWSGELASIVKHLILGAPDDVQQPDTRPSSVFFSYCHRDEGLRDELARHLKLLERAGLIEAWHDRKIRSGDEWSADIDARLYTADLILLLLSSDFFASDYCSEIEAPVALERHNVNAARAIPVVLRPVVWRHSPLAVLQALPTDARPITSWDSLDSAFVNVCEGILGSVLAWKDQTAVEEPQPARRFSARKRVVDAAMPAEVEIDKSAMLVVLFRRPSSAGLRGLLAGDITYGLEPGDVRSKRVSLQFPIGEANKPESVSLTVLLKAPDFDPPEQKRTLTLQPNGDSQPLIFMLAAKRGGALKAVVEIYDQDELVTSCPVSTLAGEAEVLKPASPNIASSTFDVEEGVGPVILSPAAPPVDPGELMVSEDTALGRALAESSELIEQSRFEEAIRFLESFCSRFPDSPQLRAMLAVAREALREALIAQKVAESEYLLQQDRLSDAMEVLDHALANFPDAGQLRTLRKTVASERQRRRVEEERRRSETELAERQEQVASEPVGNEPIRRMAGGESQNWAELERYVRAKVDDEKERQPAPAQAAKPLFMPSLELDRPRVPFMLLIGGLACLIALVVFLLLR